MNEYMEAYIAEAKELLDEMNGSLLKLEKNTGDMGLINSIFRAAHTIKGNSASLGFKRMENLTHSMEDLLQDIRDGKVQIDKKIMELLFVCHDFLEGGLYTIMQTGNEEEMNIDGILGKLHLVIEEKHEKLNKENACSSDKSLDCTDMTLNNQELSNLKRNIDANLNPYLIKMNLSDNCIFKSVRIWMWFQEMSTYLNVIKSEPDQPTSDDVKDSSYVFPGNVLQLLAVSKYDMHQLLGNLNKLVDAADIQIEPLKYNDTDFINNQIKLVMTKAVSSVPDIEEAKEDAEAAVSYNQERIIEIESAFLNDFINEILEQITKAEADMQALEQKPENNNTFYQLSRSFHTIKGLAGFIDHTLMVKISVTVELLIEYYRKLNSKAGNTQLGLISASADFIRKLCENTGLSDDSDFVNTVETHINKIKNEINDELPAAENNEEDKLLPDGLESDGNLHEVKSDMDSLHSQAEHDLHKNSGKSLDSSFMRISTQKIDSLVDMLGELLILHSLMELEAAGRFGSDDKYMNNLLRMAKIIKGIQTLSMSLRMVSLKQVFQKTMRVGRDTAAEISKLINITVAGEETEIDRNIADKLVDPMMHLVRNAVSHGIESEAERTKKGKTKEGHINIHAYSKRGYVYVEIEDDGCGLDIDKIQAKAIEKNLIDPNSNYSAEEIMKFIFLPGFSTREMVDNISGRGVGMNVVETEIKKVGGKIDILNKPGEGCKFVIKIPLNLAVMNGTIVDIYGDRYIIPTLYIKQFMKPDDSQWLKVKNKKTMIRVRNEVIQVIPADKVFGFEGLVNDEDENMVVIIEVEQKFKALPVRSVIGRQEIVAKPLGKEFGGLDFAAGASILGDGKVALILDAEAIFKTNNSHG